MNNKELPQTNMSYPYPMAYQDNDEIDLVELFRTLWKQKAKIALVTVATTLAAGIYAFTAEEVWTAKAVIEQPKLEDINDYYSTVENIRLILQKPAIGELALQPDKIAQEAYIEFKEQLESLDLRKDFWRTSDFYSYKIKNKTSKLDKDKELNELAEKNIRVDLADGKKIMHTSIALSIDTAVGAKFMLERYMSKINSLIWQRKTKELDVLLAKEVAKLVHEKSMIEFDSETYRKNNIIISENAKNIAEKANIKDFNIAAMQGNANVNKSDMLFFLGTKALDAQIDNLKNHPLMLPARYYEIENILANLNKISKLNSVNVKSYRYLTSPTEPVEKDKPKKVLIVLGGIVAGLFLGGLMVLFSTVYSVKSKKE